MALAFASCGDSGSNNTTETSQTKQASAISTSVSTSDTGALTESTTEASTVASTTQETTSSTEKHIKEYTPLNYEYMKGTWLYQYTENGLFRDGRNGQRDIEEYTERVTKIVTNLERDGYNTIFLQVRPYGDSFYPSEYYCPSNFVTDGYDGEFEYDPLEIFIKLAHEHNISIHAWLNPMRLMTSGSIDDVPDNYLVKQWYDNEEGLYVVKLKGRYYLNPSYEETRQLVIDGAVEICEKYDIDGIHLDDYFYPEGVENSFDNEAYLEMAYPNNISRKQFRYNNVNALVKGLYDAVHGVDERLLFGISPAGNISNNRGYLSADVDTWCGKPGYIDYIAPQVYWSFDYSWDPAKFDICSESWAKLIKTDSVRLVLGIGLYRAVNPSYNETDPGWFEYKDNIKRMLEYGEQMDECSGWILFSYESMYNAVTGDYNNAIREERENFMPVMKAEESVKIKYE